MGSLAHEIAALLAVNLGLPPQAIPIAPDTPLFGVMPELDSMSVVTFLISVEEQYGIVIHDDEIDAGIFESLGSLTSFMQSKLS
jgi:acyl carrier protein